ncbi:Glutamyl-tRNA(Gln) amidotransferase subunit C mitochondrial [Trichostrongylus colubriformis]|uniref:Glutamyl-tRNA(Gln) amidotransferase subunit C, mitochondrial n=1 Tax=Trichostrongylus colubriformis TaxID=6319 RepID=A0AAN8J281_TRICO
MLSPLSPWALKSGIRLVSRVVGSGKYAGDLPLVPTEPEISQVENTSAEAPRFDKKLILLLESLSLLRFDDEQAVALLGTVVKKAKLLQNVDVTNVPAMFTVWEQLECPLNDDIPGEDSSAKQVLSNAAKVQDGYFVSPPGNIPLAEGGSLDHDLINQWDQIGLPRAIKPKKQKFDVSGDT